MYSEDQKQGILSASGCYVLWGILPLFWKLLSGVPALKVLSMRMFWSAVFVAILCIFVRSGVKQLFKEPRAIKTFLLAGVIVSFNWGIYIWGVNSGHVLECAMGYYINPLITILIGILFFKEKLSRWQAAAFVLASIGVLYFTIDYGRFPWLSLALALSFGAYGAVKKKGAYPALSGMAMESCLTGLFAVIMLLIGALIPEFWQLTPVSNPSPWAVSNPTALFFLFIVAGIVTFVPLYFFANAANKVPLTYLGFLQYLSPSINLVLAVTVFKEAFTLAHGVTFACIWLGLSFIIAEAIKNMQGDKDTPAAAAK